MDKRTVLQTYWQAQDAFLLACGWLPVDESNLVMEWRHPHDRDNIWDREKALEMAELMAINEGD